MRKVIRIKDIAKAITPDVKFSAQKIQGVMEKRKIKFPVGSIRRKINSLVEIGLISKIGKKPSVFYIANKAQIDLLIEFDWAVKKGGPCESLAEILASRHPNKNILNWGDEFSGKPGTSVLMRCV
jgi:hypothetical protein